MNTEINVSLNLKGDIERIGLKPGDILSIRLSGEYSDPDSMGSIAWRMRKMLHDAGHENQVIVSDSRMEILVITPDP